MPITQERLASIIRAAQASLDALAALRARIVHCAAMPDSEAALASIASAAQSTLFAPAAEHIALIAREAEHLRLTKHKNARSAAHMKRRRIARGIAPKTAPTASDESPGPSGLGCRAGICAQPDVCHGICLWGAEDESEGPDVLSLPE